MAREIHASSVHGSTSESLLSRRYRPSQAKVRSTTQRRGSTWPWLRGGAHQIADQSYDVFRYESPDLATRLTLIHETLIHEEGRTSRCPRVLTDERG
jgi:hypothetical protein